MADLAASDNAYVAALFAVTKGAKSDAHADKTKARRDAHATTDLRGIVGHITSTYTDAEEQSAAFATLRGAPARKTMRRVIASCA